MKTINEHELENFVDGIDEDGLSIDELNDGIGEDGLSDSEEESTLKIGVVVNCGLLRIRKNPFTTAEVLGEVRKNSEVLVDTDKSTSEFYSVKTKNGLSGFCMNKFIKLS